MPGVQSAAVGTVFRSPIVTAALTLRLTEWHSRRREIILIRMFTSSARKYVETLGISLLRGRSFTDDDNENAPLAGMINAMVARRFFPNEDPIGKRFMFGHPSATNPPKWYTIVGVVSDTRLYGLANPARLEVYLPFRQRASNGMAFIVKSSADPAALTTEIREAVQSIDKDQPIFAISTMEKLRSNSVATRRMTLVLLGLFSGLALDSRSHWNLRCHFVFGGAAHS